MSAAKSIYTIMFYMLYSLILFEDNFQIIWHPGGLTCTLSGKYRGFYLFFYGFLSVADQDLQIMGGGGHPDPEIRGGGVPDPPLFRKQLSL